jgi:hypothetical protein
MGRKQKFVKNNYNSKAEDFKRPYLIILLKSVKSLLIS